MGQGFDCKKKNNGVITYALEQASYDHFSQIVANWELILQIMWTPRNITHFVSATGNDVINCF